MSEMSSLDHLERWHCITRLEIEDVAALMSEEDPQRVQEQLRCNRGNVNDCSPRFQAKLAMLREALADERLKITKVTRTCAFSVETTIYLEQSELLRWFRSEGLKPRFFFPDGREFQLAPPTADPPYLDACHPYYAPKLAAAVSAWVAVVQSITTGVHDAGTFRTSVHDWLEAHQAEYAFDGKEPQDGRSSSYFNQMARVANCDADGMNIATLRASRERDIAQAEIPSER